MTDIVSPAVTEQSPAICFGQLPLGAVMESHPSLVQALRPYDPVYTASLVAGLLTEPALQGNCVRLEALIHLALFAGAGKKKPTPRAIATWFEELGAGPCVIVEDPPEDAFSTVITTPQGNFRIVEGIWESATFYLQRFVNIVERTPGNDTWLSLRESMRAMLKLSELVCGRSGLARYAFGRSSPTTLPREIERSIASLRQRVTFNVAELKEHGITLEALEPFLFHPDLRNRIPEASLTHSPLIHHPLLHRSGQLIVALPTAASIAIRGLVAGGAVAQGAKEPFLHLLAQEYEDYFHDDPPLDIGFGAPLHFQKTDRGMMASVAMAIDLGRWLQVILVLDTLEGFEETAFAGGNLDPNQLTPDFDLWIEKCREMAAQEAHYRGGLTVIIGCGIGRAAYHRLSGKQREDWQTVYLSAPDVATLGDLRQCDAKNIWRIIEAEDRLAAHGIELVNLNGLLNLIAWVRSLDGHLIAHSQISAEWQGQQGRILIDPSMVLEVRREATLRIDRHAVSTEGGPWIEVRKTGDSVFTEDQEAPLYVPTRMDSTGRIPIVYEGTGRYWWCQVTAPREYARWKLMSTWLPRIAAVLDTHLTSLPAIISFEVAFDGYGKSLESFEDALDRNAIEADIRVTTDETSGSLDIAAGALFEKGLSQPENVAEAALVASIVRGCLEMTDHKLSGNAETLIQEIVGNEQARDCHCFQARRFRDFVADKLRDDPVRIDPIDAATIRLGLGWRVRSGAEGGDIEGRTECNAFLNALVSELEQELCLELHRFNRQSLIEMALQNHELAMARQATWRRTTSAILGLHRDQSDAKATIAEQEFENNGVLQASRVLIELAVCECPANEGETPGEMDLSLLMARLLLLTQLGDWSDAIFHGGMEASILVTPLGDVHVPIAFIDHVVKPFGDLANDSMIDGAVAGYAQNFAAPHITGAAEAAFDPAFVEAWCVEKQAPLDSFRRFVDDVEDAGIKQESPVLMMPLSELLRLYSGDDGAAEAIVRSLSTTPRANWLAPPEGMLDKDRWPWRYRRRLSLLRLPLIQLDDGEDPLIVVAPGLLRDAVVYTVDNFHEGYFPCWQIQTNGMRTWAGTAADRRGSRFSQKVAVQLRELGWQADVEVKVSQIVGKRLDRDYGDVDVLAWSHTSKRILLIECKDLHFH